MSRRKNTAPPEPSTVTLRYIGPMPRVAITFPSTGRSFEIARNEEVELLLSEAANIEDRPDFQSADAEVPDPSAAGQAGNPVDPEDPTSDPQTAPEE